MRLPRRRDRGSDRDGGAASPAVARVSRPIVLPSVGRRDTGGFHVYSHTAALRRCRNFLVDELTVSPVFHVKLGGPARRHGASTQPPLTPRVFPFSPCSGSIGLLGPRDHEQYCTAGRHLK